MGLRNVGEKRWGECCAVGSFVWNVMLDMKKLVELPQRYLFTRLIQRPHAQRHLERIATFEGRVLSKVSWYATPVVIDAATKDQVGGNSGHFSTKCVT